MCYPNVAGEGAAAVERFRPVTAGWDSRVAAGSGWRLAAGGIAAALACHAAPAGASSACRYDVEASANLVLNVAVRCDAGVHSLRHTRPGLRRYLREVHGERAGDGFQGRYRLDLGAMAKEKGSIDSALAVGDSILAVGAAWLLRPVRDAGGPGVLRVRVRTPPGLGFDTGQPVAEGYFTVPVGELDHAGFSAFGAFRTHELPANGGRGDAEAYRVVVLDGELDVDHGALLDWIGSMAGAATEFWHGFPVPGLPIYVVPRPGQDGVPFGRVMAGGGVSLVLYVGEHATVDELRSDWVLIHELVHAGFPFVPGAPWFLEGLATYFEPLIRARYGLQTPEAMWTEFMTYMPRGASVMEETGLARGGFRGWYWGGALVMLMTDVEMRRASQGATGLEDCLRRVHRDTGDYRRALALDEVLDACASMAGGHSLRETVDKYVFSSGVVNQDRLWRDLGLKPGETPPAYINDAPLARIREAIVRGSLE